MEAGQGGTRGQRCDAQGWKLGLDRQMLLERPDHGSFISQAKFLSFRQSNSRELGQN